jgi:hypothetical protein
MSKNILYRIIAILAVLLSIAVPHQLYAASDGNDGNDGTPTGNTKEIEAQRSEQRLQDALRAVNTPGESRQGLESLVGIDDDEATSALIKAAKAPDSKEKSDINRVVAVRALWHHAADLKFENKTVNSALKALTSDKVERVRQIASEAVDDMDKYLAKK